MPDNAAQADPAPPPPPEPEAQDTEATTDWEAKATELSKRFSGSQKALNDAIARTKAVEAERDALAVFKATAERSNMSEVEAAKADAEAARAEAAAARAEAERHKMARLFPHAIAELGDDEPLPSEAALARLEAKLAAQSGDETDQEPRIDPNNPRRSAPASQREKTGDELDAEVKSWPGNPWANAGH